MDWTDRAFNIGGFAGRSQIKNRKKFSLVNKVVISEMQQDRPFLGLPLPNVPPDKPTTKLDLLRALYGYFNGNLKSFTVAKLSCSRRSSDNSSRCKDEDGCSRLDRKCFLYQVHKDKCLIIFSYFAQVSKIWKDAEVPLKQDRSIIENVVAVKTKYQKILKVKHKLSEDEKQEYIEGMKTTFNIADNNWRQLVETDTILTAPQKEEKISVILDYIGDSATRYCIITTPRSIFHIEIIEHTNSMETVSTVVNFFLKFLPLILYKRVCRLLEPGSLR